MNLLASPLADILERSAVVLGKKALRSPLIALAASLLLVAIGYSTIAGQVRRSSQTRRAIAAERMSLDRELVVAHVRERRLRSSLSIVRHMASIERVDRRMLESVASVANDTPNSVWFVALTVDHHTVTVQARTDSFAAISAMLRATSKAAGALVPRVRSVLRSPDPRDPILAFTMEIQHTSPTTERSYHART